MSDANTLLIPRDTSYLRTMPFPNLMRLWDVRLERMVHFILTRAPQIIIDRERELVYEARDAATARAGEACP